jgi:hypothetical protein
MLLPSSRKELGMPWRRAGRPRLHHEAAVLTRQISSGGRQQATGWVPHQNPAPRKR